MMVVVMMVLPAQIRMQSLRPMLCTPHFHPTCCWYEGDCWCRMCKHYMQSWRALDWDPEQKERMFEKLNMLQ